MNRLPSLLLKNSAALVLAVLGGCGGRTEYDPYEFGYGPSPASSAPTGSSSGGRAMIPPVGGTAASPAAGGSPATGGSSTPAGGAPNVGTGGSGPIPIPSAGAGGTAGAGIAGAATGGFGGLDPALVSNCADFCKSNVSGSCPSMVSVADCRTTCEGELGTRSWQCQQIAIEALACLTTVYNNSKSCSDFERYSAAKCAGIVAKYDDCVSSTPVPTPATPVCSLSGSLTDKSCTRFVKCDVGVSYSASCSETSTKQSVCSCSTFSPDGAGSGSTFVLNEPVTFACEDTFAACGFPQSGIK